MNEVKKCSISGIAFTFDTDAYEALTKYLDSLQETYGDSKDGSEIIADIEARIAELILSAQDNTRVIAKPLVCNIIMQLGSAEDISDESCDEQPKSKKQKTTAAPTPRIPRRLYRDTENAKLGGVCAGVAQYFDIDTVWVRLAVFAPIFILAFSWIPFMWWIPQAMGNLFGGVIIAYIVMWFVVPAARSARQKLEMTGEKITSQSIKEATVTDDTYVRSTLSNVLLICLKIFAGILVFALIMAACGCIIGIFAVGFTGLSTPLGTWVPILGICIGLTFIIMLLYVLMCLIASHKPNGKIVLLLFLLFIASIIACSVAAIKQNSISNLIENVSSNVGANEALYDDIESQIEDEFEANRDILFSENGDITIPSGNSSNVDISHDDNGEATVNIKTPQKSVKVKVEVKDAAKKATADSLIVK